MLCIKLCTCLFVRCCYFGLNLHFKKNDSDDVNFRHFSQYNISWVFFFSSYWHFSLSQSLCISLFYLTFFPIFIFIRLMCLLSFQLFLVILAWHIKKRAYNANNILIYFFRKIYDFLEILYTPQEKQQRIKQKKIIATSMNTKQKKRQKKIVYT